LAVGHDRTTRDSIGLYPILKVNGRLSHRLSALLPACLAAAGEARILNWPVTRCVYPCARREPEQMPMPPAAYAHAETEIDFSQRKRGIGRYWHVTLFSALAVTALALFVTGEIPPRYYAESRIAITPAENTDAQSAADD